MADQVVHTDYPSCERGLKMSFFQVSHGCETVIHRKSLVLFLHYGTQCSRLMLCNCVTLHLSFFSSLRMKLLECMKVVLCSYSQVKCIEQEKTSVQVYLNDNNYDMYILYIFTFWFVVRFACTPHGPSAKFLVENGE